MSSRNENLHVPCVPALYFEMPAEFPYDDKEAMRSVLTEKFCSPPFTLMVTTRNKLMVTVAVGPAISSVGELHVKLAHENECK